MKKIKEFFSTTVLLITMLILMGTLFFVACEKDYNEPLDLGLDKSILNSSELEDYIIAGADLQKSLAVFTAQLKKIDLSKLEVTYDAKGRKVVRLFPSSVNNRIEEKVQTFNVKKKALQERFPQFVKFRKDAAKKYFKQSIQYSLHINSEFLKLGINTSRRLLKDGDEGSYGEDEAYLTWYLANWVENPDYTEISIIYYEDGKIATYQNPANTDSTLYITTKRHVYEDGTYVDDRSYFPEGGSSSPINSIGHTHRNSANASPQDTLTHFAGASRFIYYQGSYYYY